MPVGTRTGGWGADESKVTLELLLKEGLAWSFVDGLFRLGIGLVLDKCIALWQKIRVVNLFLI